MSGLFSIAELIESTGGRVQNVSAKSVSSISIDSRALKRGALFVAIKGDRFDGHDFVAAAIKNGATLALVSEARVGILEGLPLLVVPDALAGLGQLAVAARARSGAKVVAITGSAGKTTAKEMVRSVLERAGEPHASIKSYNNHWGVPLMLAGLPSSAQFGVFEIGMNHGGEITPLSNMVRPHIALITNIGSAHIGNFKNMEGIARAKGEIFSGIEPGGAAIVNADHAYMILLKELAEKAGVKHFVTYGFAESADIVIRNADFRTGGSDARVNIGGRDISLVLNVPGEHMLANAVGALCVAEHLGLTTQDTLAAIAEFSAPIGRGAVYRLGSKTNPLVLIDESYNANPASMAAALGVFSAQKPVSGRKILVLADMFELGEKADILHARLIPEIEQASPDLLFAIGEYLPKVATELAPQIKVGGAADRLSEIEQLIVNSLDYGDLVMVKGSNGVGLGLLVKAIRSRFAGGG